VLKVVGITGKSGSGKSELLRAMGALGAATADADAVYHSLLETCGPMLAGLMREFPDCFEGEKLQRKKLGQRVFADKAALKKLGELTHPYVLKEIYSLAERARLSGAEVFAVEAIALFESGLAEKCSLTVAVIAENTSKRIEVRDDVSEAYANSRLKAQRQADEFAEMCDIVIKNDGTIEKLQEQAALLMQKLKGE